MPGNRGEEETPALVGFYLAVAAVVLADQASKFFALRYLGDSSLSLIPGIFHLTLVHNQGVAFGFFRDHRILLLGVISASIAVLVFWARRARDLPELERAGLALILGGALGNWIDRMRWGAVVDFLDFRVWPVFNLADSAITVGVALYLLVLLRRKS